MLVFAAPGAAGVLDDGHELGLTLLAFVSFCLAASGIYFWNDVLDVDADRAHPAKRFRPIAAGTVPLGRARVVGTLLVVGALGVAAGTGRWETVGIVGAYVVMTITYSAWLKHVAVVDLVIVASGFVLRAAGRRRRRRRADVGLVRAVHRVRLAVHRHREALRRAARVG